MIREEKSWGQQLLGCCPRGHPGFAAAISRGDSPGNESWGWAEESRAWVRSAPQEEWTPPQNAHTTSQLSLLLLPVCDLHPQLPSQADFGVMGAQNHPKLVQRVPSQEKKKKNTSQKTNSSESEAQCLRGTRKQGPASFFTHSSSPQVPPAPHLEPHQKSLPPTYTP